jgi:hypothetical protein
MCLCSTVDGPCAAPPLPVLVARWMSGDGENVAVAQLDDAHGPPGRRSHETRIAAGSPDNDEIGLDRAQCRRSRSADCLRRDDSDLARGGAGQPPPRFSEQVRRAVWRFDERFGSQPGIRRAWPHRHYAERALGPIGDHAGPCGRVLAQAGWADCRSGRRSSRRRSWALIATTIVEMLMRMAPTAGAKTSPTGARTPAASGIAMML